MWKSFYFLFNIFNTRETGKSFISLYNIRQIIGHFRYIKIQFDGEA